MIILFIFRYLLRSVVPVDKDNLTLIFAATRHHVEFLMNLIISMGIDATCIYGSMDMVSLVNTFSIILKHIFILRVLIHGHIKFPNKL